MESTQLTGVLHPTGMGDDTNLIGDITRITGNAFCLVIRIQAFLELGIMGGDTGGAGVSVALQGLYATQ
jgi:hypothetical protein